MTPLKQIPNDDNYPNHNWFSQEKCNIMNSTLIPIPGIIAQLGRLVSSSMQQPLDSALRWPTGLSGKIEGMSTQFKFYIEESTILKNPLSFKKSLQQISRQLAKVLRKMYANNESVFLKMKEAWKIWPNTIGRFKDAHKLIDYLNRLKEETTMDVISQPLGELKEAFDKIVRFSNQNLIELQKMASLIEAFATAVYNIRSAKVDYTNNILRKQLDAKTKRMNELGTEVTSLKEEYEQLDYNATQSERNFNKYLDRLLYSVRKHQKNPTVRSCLENEAKKWDTKDDFYVTCGAKSSILDRKNMREARIAKCTWKTFLRDLHNIKGDLEEKEEKHQNLSLSVRLLEQKKNRLDQDILFLNNSANLTDELENKMEELFLGWKNIATLCKEIQSAVAFTMKTTLKTNTPNSLVNFKKPVSRKEILQETFQLLTNTTEKISFVGRAISVYLAAYEIDLTLLVSQLEQMTVNGDENLIVLEEKLIDACNNTSTDIKTVLDKIQSFESN